MLVQRPVRVGVGGVLVGGRGGRSLLKVQDADATAL